MIEIEHYMASELIQLQNKSVIHFDEISFIKSDGHYLEFHLRQHEKIELDRNTIKYVKSVLPSDKFVQIHRSYIINIYDIKSYSSKELIMKKGAVIPISRTYKNLLKELILKL